MNRPCLQKWPSTCHQFSYRSKCLIRNVEMNNPSLWGKRSSWRLKNVWQSFWIKPYNYFEKYCGPHTKIHPSPGTVAPMGEFCPFQPLNELSPLVAWEQNLWSKAHSIIENYAHKPIFSSRGTLAPTGAILPFQPSNKLGPLVALEQSLCSKAHSIFEN